MCDGVHGRAQLSACPCAVAVWTCGLPLTSLATTASYVRCLPLPLAALCIVVMMTQMQGVLSDAATHCLVSPGILATHATVDDDVWRAEHVHYYIVAKGAVYR
jgi:hypothetical protein